METELTTSAQQSMSDVGRWLVTNQSRLISAVALLAIGLLLAFVLRMLAVRIVAAFERAAPGRELRTSFAGVVRERRISEIVGSLVSWGVLLFFIASAANVLGLVILNTIVASLSQFVPRVLVAVLILIAGLVLGNLARAALASTAGAATVFGAGVGHLVRIAIVTAAVLIAVAELGVDIALLTAIFSVALAALLGGFALAFGLGARTAIANIIGSHYLRKTFEIGQTVRIGGVEGKIAELTATAVILEGPNGRTIVPAKQFGEMPSELLVKRDAS